VAVESDASLDQTSVGPHVPAAQTCPLLHAVQAAPQWEGSVFVLKHEVEPPHAL